MSELDDILKELDDWAKEFNDKMDAEAKAWAQAHPIQAACDHGISFDKEAALALLNKTPLQEEDPVLVFVMGSPAASEIRKRWPRLHGPCPKGCGFSGIAYASHEHYIYGDW